MNRFQQGSLFKVKRKAARTCGSSGGMTIHLKTNLQEADQWGHR
jgi:hypothetical protein